MKLSEIIMDGWKSYTHKVANGLLAPENEMMMQLQLAQIYQTLAPVYEYDRSESIKVLLEVPVTIRGSVSRIIDIVISHTMAGSTSYYAIELKCFRLLTRRGTGKRGAQNLGMYDYWEDIENIEGYAEVPGHVQAFQFTLTDDPYYANTPHRGSQVAVYSTHIGRTAVTGKLDYKIPNRAGSIGLGGSYSMANWIKMGSFYFISQQTPPSQIADVSPQSSGPIEGS